MTGTAGPCAAVAALLPEQPNNRQCSKHRDRHQEAHHEPRGGPLNARVLIRWAAEVVNSVQPGSGDTSAGVHAAAVHSGVEAARSHAEASTVQP